MLGKKIVSLKKLAKKVKTIGKGHHDYSRSHHEYLLGEFDGMSVLATTPIGFFAIYVGEERERFVVPTSFLSHPLFKMLLEKAFTDESGFERKSSRLVLPCSVSTFQEVVNAVECCNRRFEFGDFVEEFI